MSEEPRFLLRVRYQKSGRLRYLGHLDLLRTLERSIRRAGLPFAVTQGFSPHMKCAYSAALPVGAASDSEYFDLTLTEYVPAEQALERLSASMPADVAPIAAGYVDVRSMALGAWLDRARWVLALEGGFDVDALEAAIGGLEEAGSFSFKRGKKVKTCDLGKTLVGWELVPADKGAILTLDTRSSNEGALRPDALVRAAFEAMGEEPPETVQVARAWQRHENEDGELVDAL